MLLAALCGEHLLLLGPPGTAKSELSRRMANITGGSYYERLLTRFSVPEELFGPLSMRGAYTAARSNRVAAGNSFLSVMNEGVRVMFASPTQKRCIAGKSSHLCSRRLPARVSLDNQVNFTGQSGSYSNAKGSAHNYRCRIQDQSRSCAIEVLKLCKLNRSG